MQKGRYAVELRWAVGRVAAVLLKQREYAVELCASMCRIKAAELRENGPPAEREAWGHVRGWEKRTRPIVISEGDLG